MRYDARFAHRSQPASHTGRLLRQLGIVLRCIIQCCAQLRVCVCVHKCGNTPIPLVDVFCLFDSIFYAVYHLHRFLLLLLGVANTFFYFCITMGGDGGTLNNTRAEHARLRRSGTSASASASTARASVSLCALSQVPLRRGEVVVDRSGALYNKSALLAHFLDSVGGEAKRQSGVPHIRRIKRDVADVRYEPSNADDANGSPPLCVVTRAVARADGSFSVGWNCGCVTAAVDAKGSKVPSEQATECAACGTKGNRVPLGATKKYRDEVITGILETRARKKKRKLESVDAEEDASKKVKVKQAVPDEVNGKQAEEQEKDECSTAKTNGDAVRTPKPSDAVVKDSYKARNEEIENKPSVPS